MLPYCLHRFLPNIIAGLALAALPAAAGVLYRTDYESFTSGNDKWVGTDGWIGNNTDRGVHGIDQDAIAGGGLGKTAFIGLSQPNTTLAFVAKPIQYSPQAGDLPLVRVETLVGIQDSIVKTPRDSFFVSVYNNNNSEGFLAGIRFDNRPATYGIWRADGANADHDTGVIFYRGELHLLSCVINFPANRWSADLDGIPLFENAPFTATTHSVNFGYLAYEWQLGATTPSGYGDNWMLIADTVVRSAPLGIEPFQLSSLTHTAVATTLTWPGQNGFDYQIEYSNDLIDWRRDLTGSAFPSTLVDLPLTFQDAASGLPRRFYRVLRSETP
jgi:hypothetical protein